MSKGLDITGDVYGELSVISYSHTGERYSKYYRCECSCGKEVVVSKGHLRSGHTKSCGCTHKGHRKDITGTRYGKLVAVSSTGEIKGRSVVWKCLCDCGNEKEVSVSSLSGGGVNSCGCLQHQGSPLDLVNKVFGRLTVTKSIGKNKAGQYIWECQCSCGNIHETTGTSLVQGYTKSCGCYAKEVRGKANTTHGLSHTPEYGAWKNAIARCYNTNNKKYADYGGRGISVCSGWMEEAPLGFLNFMEDMGKSNGLTLERVDVNKGYCPENCIWADVFTQGYNTRMHSSNTSGRTGVSELKSGKWQVYINVKGKRLSLGTYSDFEVAVKTREAAEIKYYGEVKEQL